MEALNILRIDRDMYETTYRDEYIYMFEPRAHFHTASYINKCLHFGVEATRDARFYGTA